MTPDDFPDHTSYLRYIEECEASMSAFGMSAFGRGPGTYWQDTLIERCHAYYTLGCKYNQLDCPGHMDPEYQYPDGIKIYYAKGAYEASHATQPMFKLKSHREECGNISENYLDRCGLCNHPTRENFWEDYRLHWNREAYNVFNALGEDCNLKPAQPDYELSVRASHP